MTGRFTSSQTWPQLVQDPLWVTYIHSSLSHTLSVWTLTTRSLPDLMRKDGKRGTEERRDKQEVCARVDVRDRTC